jgi:hypothetical protein
VKRREEKKREGKRRGEQNRTRRKCRHRWEDDIKMNLK